MHAVAGTVCAADEQPSQDLAVFFPIVQQGAHHLVGIFHFHASCCPERKIGFQIIGAIQEPEAGFGAG